MNSKAGKRLVPVLRFPEFGEAGNWNSKPLKDLAEVVLGSSPSSEAYSSDAVGIPFMQGNADIKNGVSAPRLFTKQITKECQIGDTLLGVRAPVGSVAKSRHHACIGRGLAAIRVRLPNAQEYIYQWLLSFEPQWQKISQGGTFDSINGDDIRGLSVAVPHESKEQQKIAACLSSLDNLIFAQAKKIESLKAHKKGLMQQLFPADGETVPRLRFPEFRKGADWNRIALGGIGKNLDNKRVPIAENSRVKGKVPYYGASGVVDYVRDFIFDEELLCISEDGANLVARTTPIAFSISGKSWVNNHAHVVRFEHQSTQLLVEHYLNSLDLSDYLTGMAQPKLNKAMLDCIPIPLPSLAEQKKVAGFLLALSTLLFAHTQKLDTLKTFKKGLMQQLFPTLDELTV